MSSTVLRWDDWCAGTVIVGMLSIRCADIWSLSNQSRGRPVPGAWFAPHRASYPTRAGMEA